MAKKKYDYDSYKETKKIYSHAKKYAKKNPKGFLIFLCVLVVVAGLGIGGYFIYKNMPQPPHHELDFHLNGATVVTLQVNGDPYVEEGFVATYDGVDISDHVTTTYHKTTRTGPIVDTIDNTQIATYYAVYDLEYEDLELHELSRQIKVSESGGISITFLHLNNWNTGDCTYIKAQGQNGETTDILIDAGAVKSCGTTICEYLKRPGNVDDRKLEYVIATHSHEDHISAFLGNSGQNNGVFDNFAIDNIIQFSKVESETQLYKDYKAKVAELAAGGTTVYDANQCVQSNKVFNIGLNITMKILDQKYYRESAGGNENNHSVCTLITQLSHNYLFTGDLELNGEQSLAQLNDLPHCSLFKGGHHGSPTANNDCLLNEITPDIVCICCCAGSNQYATGGSGPTVNNVFPAQDAINRIAKHTDRIYVTTLCTSNTNPKTFTKMNGNITVSSNGGAALPIVTGDNHSLKLRETDWFKANRTWPDYGVIT